MTTRTPLLPPPPPRPPARVLAIAAAMAVGAALPVIRTWMLQFGATEAELDAHLPGDDLIASPDLVATRVVGIAAAPDQVWPWVAQLGQGRGGFYSYDCLENLVGCDVRSADRVEARWQDVRVGDPFRLHPEVALEVVAVEPGRALVVRGAVGVTGSTTSSAGAPPYDFTWAFVLRRGRDGGTRLVVRERYGYTRRGAALLVEPVSVVSFVMTQKMLRGLRDRAERVAA